MNDVIWKPNAAQVRKRRGRLFLFISSIFEKIKKIVLWFFVIIPVLTVLVFFLIRYMTSDKFNVKDIGFFGAELTDPADIELVRQEFIGKNIFFLRTSVVEEKMREKGAYVSTVYVEKILPDRIEVHIEEKIPEVIYIDFTNAYLVTRQSEVIDVLSDDREIQLNDEEIAILKGFGDPNADYVSDRIVSKHPEIQEDSSLPLLEKEKRNEEREKFIESITIEEKKATLNEIQEEIRAKIEQIFTGHTEKVAVSRFPDLPRAFVYENKKYEIGDHIEEERISFFLDVVAFIGDLAEFDIERYQWDSSFALSVHIKGGKSFYFSTKRDFALQSEDLIFVLNEIRTQGESFVSIDVGSDKVVVER